jgi:hypothetical protein
MCSPLVPRERALEEGLTPWLRSPHRTLLHVEAPRTEATKLLHISHGQTLPVQKPRGKRPPSCTDRQLGLLLLRSSREQGSARRSLRKMVLAGSIGSVLAW